MHAFKRVFVRRISNVNISSYYAFSSSGKSYAAPTLKRSNVRSYYSRPTSICYKPAAVATKTRTSTEDGETSLSLPSNLTFDRRSSYAPKLKPLLSTTPPPPPITPTISIEKPKDDDDDYQDGFVEGSTNQTNQTQEVFGVVDDYDADINDDIEYSEEDDDTIDTESYMPSSKDKLRPVILLPERLRQTIYNGPDGSEAGTIWLDKSIFGVDPIRVDLMKRTVDYIRAKIRGRRNAKTKTISEKSGSGRKIRQQKGTGKARAGHSRPAHFRGGVKAHGPKNTKDYGNIKLNKKVKSLAMKSTLSQKLKEGNFILVNHLQLPSHKTKDWSRTLQSVYGIGKEYGGTSALVLDHYYEEDSKQGNDNNKKNDSSFHASYHGVPINLWVASSNIYKVKVANQRFANVYDILKKEKLLVTLSALEQIEKRWSSDDDNE